VSEDQTGTVKLKQQKYQKQQAAQLLPRKSSITTISKSLQFNSFGNDMLRSLQYQTDNGKNCGKPWIKFHLMQFSDVIKPTVHWSIL